MPISPTGAEWSAGTLDEAVALAFRKAPEVVNWKSIERYADVSQFATEYSKLLRLAQRALPDPVKPAAFVVWARSVGSKFPAELETALSERTEKTAKAPTEQEWDQLRKRVAELEAQIRMAKWEF